MPDSSSIPDPLLDRCITALLEQGRSVEECLADFPAQGKPLEPLLRLAVCLETAGGLQAPVDFRLTASQRMSNLIAASPRAAFPNGHRGGRARLAPRLGWRPFPRLSWAGVASLLALVLALAGLGVVSAAGKSLPGETLYPVKLEVEAAQRSLSASPAQDARLQVTFTQERFDEAVSLAEKERTSTFGSALQDYTTRLADTMQRLSDAHSLPVKDRSSVARSLADDLAGNHQRLNRLLSNPPAGFQNPQQFRREVETALQAIQTSYDRASGWIILLPGAATLVPQLETQAQQTWMPSQSNLLLPAASATPAPASTLASAAPAEETPDFSELLTQWPSNWPDLPATPGPDMQWTPADNPWPTAMGQLPTLWPTALKQLPTLIPTILHQYLPTGMPPIPTIQVPAAVKTAISSIPTFQPPVIPPVHVPALPPVPPDMGPPPGW
jgi:hypothetical protein